MIKVVIINNHKSKEVCKLFSNRKSEVNKKRDWEHARTKLRHCKSNEKTTASDSHGYNEGAWEMGQLSVSSPSIPLSLAGCEKRQIPEYLSCINFATVC